MSSGIDIGIVTNIPSPYRVPLFNTIAKRDRINLTVYFMDVSEKNRSWTVDPEEWDFNYVFLDGSTWHSNVLDYSVAFNWGVVPHFQEASHDVIVVGGYNHTTCWTTLAYSKLSGTPVVPWNGTWSGSVRVNKHLIHTVRKLFTRSGNAWIAYGSKAAAALSSWGAIDRLIFNATNTVDVAKFAEKSKRISSQNSHNKLELLYCGQLIKRKNVEIVIDALSMLRSRDIHFKIIGEGPKRKDLQQRAERKGVNITLEGFIPRDKLHHHYTQADVLVLPSTEEVWGLVVNEALACGTPALVSTMCGCAPDLIREGFNGNTFDPTPESLAELVAALRKESIEYANSNKIRQDAVNRFSIEQAAVEFISACQAAGPTH